MISCDGLSCSALRSVFVTPSFQCLLTSFMECPTDFCSRLLAFSLDLEQLLICLIVLSKIGIKSNPERNHEER